MGKGDSITLGYRYYFKMLMGIGRTVDYLKEIQVGKVTVFREGGYPGESMSTSPGLEVGSPTSDSTTFRIDAGDAFGGDEGEGGIDGTMTIFGGKTKSAVDDNSAMAKEYSEQAQETNYVPGYLRKAIAFYDGQVCAMNPYPKAWRVRVVRYKEQGQITDLPGGASRLIPMAGGLIHAMNPAYALYETVTDPEWGRGLRGPGRDGEPAGAIRPVEIDVESFAQASHQFFREGMGMCVAWKRDGDLDAFAQTVIDMVGAVLYPHPDTGLITLGLIRDDYNVADLPVYTFDSGLLDITDNSSPTGDATINEVIVNYIDPITGDDAVVRAQSLGNIQRFGGVRSVTVSYPSCPTGELAGRLAKRDLNAKGANNLRRLKVTLDRRGFWIVPGSVFRVHVPELMINDMVVRAGMVSEAADGRISVTAMQDVFGLPKKSGVAMPIIPVVPPSPAPGVIGDDWVPQEAPYAEVVARADEEELDALTPADGLLISYAKEPPKGRNMNYAMYSGVGANLNPLPNKVLGNWVPSYRLLEDYEPGVTKMILPYALIGAGGQSHGMLLYVGGEYIQTVDQDTSNPGTVPSGHIRMNVKRGCFDTIPKKQTQDSLAFVVRTPVNVLGSMAVYKRPYLTGNNVRVQVAARSMTTETPRSQSTEKSVLFKSRMERPYPPGDVRINGTSIFNLQLIAGDIELTWVGRNRLSQDSTVVGHADGNVTPETDATYEVRIYNHNDDTLIKSFSSPDERSLTFTEAESAAAGSPRVLRIEVFSKRDTYESMEKYIKILEHLPAGTDSGWGFDYGNNYGG